MARLMTERETKQFFKEHWLAFGAGLIKSWFPDITNEKAMRLAGFSKYRAKKIAKEMAKR